MTDCEQCKRWEVTCGSLKQKLEASNEANKEIMNALIELMMKHGTPTQRSYLVNKLLDDL